MRDQDRQLREIAANFPGVILRRITWPDGRVTYPYLSDGASRIFGFTDALQAAIRDISDLGRHMPAEDLERWRNAMRQAAKTLSPMDVEGRLIGDDGRVRWFRSISRPHRREDGATIWDGIVLDISAQKQAEIEREQMATIVEASRDAIWSWSLDGTITTWNPEASRMFGYAPEEALGRSILDMTPADRHPRAREIINRVRRGEAFEQFETVRRHKDGKGIEVALTVFPIRDAEGRVVKAATIARDITERKHAEARQQLLVHELDHRVKNILSVVQAIAAQSLKGGPDDLQVLRGRIAALSGTYSLLSDERWQGASLGALLGVALAAYGGVDGNPRIEITGANVQLPSKQAQSVGLILHELATNAAKYGALSVPGGRLAIAWALEDGGLELTWRERDGPPVQRPNRKGFGSLLIQRMLSFEFGGSADLDFRPDGLVARLALPLAERHPT